MERRRYGPRWPAAALLAAFIALPGATPAQAEDARPTIDPTAPTPTAPYAGRPPQGSAPDGRTVGGEELDTRGLVVADDAPALPEGVAANGWLVADAGTGDVLAARDPHGRYYPASTLKTLTLLTLAPLLDPATVVEGTVEDENIEGSRVGLVQGGRYPVSLLLQALILQSGNDAAQALARTAGGVGVTVAAMNETAEALGAYDTVAGTPSGLDVAGQSSSPYDLALIFRALLAAPATAAVLTSPVADIPAVEGRSPGFQIQNQNPLAGTPGNLGGKTGFTDAARHTFVTAAERNGRRLVVSVMDTENVPLRAADQAALLLDWGFTVPAGMKGVGRLIEPGDAAAHATPAPAPTPRRSEPSLERDAPDGTEVAEVAAGRPSSPWVPVALGVGALTIVAATVVGRRRAVRVVPVPVRVVPVLSPPPDRPAGEGSPPRSAGASSSTRR
ncbi:D-alanyl-D-alanine carboxypeptidase family protein [Blastococcus mobilis]|uniref:D-alanyl-D-alanine carboxypeptidase (Penicillin-binding protein 5/6) n=1 Tax=Blastococcus mobilis TaxID=1938746 RepID=A0A238XEV5_9ACTN|nr:serine hydrolase [Blastococcus mobilis]SNR57457.1 D-alanyl-D-alanine carboxypeptidase (penicillin-binding protein 5/6) [Blastococcus mobilis]